MAQPTGTVENSSVLIINHPPSSVMRDWSFYTHRTTQCHTKYGWKITPNSLPSKWAQSRRGLDFFLIFFFSCTQVRGGGVGGEGGWMLESMTTPSFTSQHHSASDEHTNNCETAQLRSNIFIFFKKSSMYSLLPPKEMRSERATGSVCEVNSIRPPF